MGMGDPVRVDITDGVRSRRFCEIAPWGASKNPRLLRGDGFTVLSLE